MVTSSRSASTCEPMPWLIRDGDVLAAVEAPRRGWQGTLQGALVLRRPAVLHTLTRPAAGPLDVAWCAPATLDGGVAGLRVRRISRLSPYRVAPPHMGAGAVVVAAGGSFERWRLKVGDRLEVKGT
jgi:hypothetical protein